MAHHMGPKEFRRLTPDGQDALVEWITGNTGIDQDRITWAMYDPPSHTLVLTVALLNREGRPYVTADDELAARDEVFPMPGHPPCWPHPDGTSATWAEQ